LTTIDTRIRDLIAHVYNHAPAIRRIMDERGLTPADLQSAADLAKFPVISKDALTEMHVGGELFGGLLAIDPAHLPRIYISPGPIYDPQPTLPEDVPNGTIFAMHSIGIGRGDRVLNTFAYHLTPAGHLVDENLRLAGATVIPTGPGNTDLQIMMMNALHVTGFAGQPSYLMTFLDRCAELGIPKEQIPIKKALFSAEPYTQSQRERFEGEYGMSTTSIYGTADLGFVGFTMHGLDGFVISESMYVEICDPQSGQPMPSGEKGEIVVTSFNRGYALIRFGTGDLGALIPPEAVDPRVGDRQVLAGLYGRVGEAVKVRGMFLHPNDLRRALTQFPQVKRAQVIVTRPENSDHVEVLLELHANVDGTGIGEQLQAMAQAAVRLRIDQVTLVDPGTISPAKAMIQDKRQWD
jgi:phenylacetate-CoA ligase